MGHPEDVQMGQMAVTLAWLQPQQLELCLQVQEQSRSKGKYLPLGWWLERLGYLTAEQIRSLEQKCVALRTGISGPATDKTGTVVGRPVADSAAPTEILSPAAPPVPMSTLPGQDGEAEELTDNGMEDAKESGASERMETTVGRYQILKELGRGGMGRVYQAYDHENQRVVALKMLLDETSASDKEIKRFLREAKAMARFSHPNIVQLYETDKANGRNYFAMEFVEGTSLRERMQKSALSIDEIVKIMVQVCAAVQCAHEHGVIHRDLKPGNVMIDKGGQAKVLDFGLVKVTQASTKLSKTGVLMGTLQYMPPEQADGDHEAIDARSDVYALGATLYELLTGRPPFIGTATEILYKLAINPVDPVPPSQLNPHVPEKLEDICLKALQKNKELRYQSVGSLKQDLKRFSQGKAPTAGSSKRALALHKGVQRHKLAITLVIFLSVFVVLLVGGGMYLRRGQKAQAAENAYQEGVFYLREEKSGKAVQALLRCLALDPKRADAYNQLGVAYHRQGNLGKAGASWQKAIELDPALAGIYHNLGYFYRQMGKPEKAVPLFQKYLELAPHGFNADEIRTWLKERPK